MKDWEDWELTEWGKDLVVELSGVRIGQRDRGRLENVSGHLVHSIIGHRWDDLSEREQHAFVSESMPKLLKTYGEYLRRGCRTKEAAEIAIKAELERLSKKYLK
jgi:hypothetical protein